MQRNIAKYGIPLQVLTLVGTLACEGDEDVDPMVGSFDCTFFAQDGVRVPCPNTYTDIENGVEVSVTEYVALSMNAAGIGSAKYVLEILRDGVYDGDYSIDGTYSLVGTNTGVVGQWDILISDWNGVGVDLETRCDADADDTATCYGTDDGGTAWEFNLERVADADTIL